MFGFRLSMNNLLRNANSIFSPYTSSFSLYESVKQLQRSPQYRKSRTHCSFKHKVNIVPFIFSAWGKPFHFCSFGTTHHNSCLLHGMEHMDFTRISPCFWLSSCLHQTKSCWESADNVSVKTLKKNKKRSMIWIFFLLVWVFLTPSKVENVICPETFSQALSSRDWVWTQLNTNG